MSTEGPFETAFKQLHDVERKNFLDAAFKPHDRIGVALRCHLLAEHSLNELLSNIAPLLDWEAARVRFHQKVRLMASIQNLRHFVAGLDELNGLRNEQAHALNPRAEKWEVPVMRAFHEQHAQPDQREWVRGRPPEDVVLLFATTFDAWITATCAARNVVHRATGWAEVLRRS
jgi:hypothetical protein